MQLEGFCAHERRTGTSADQTEQRSCPVSPGPRGVNLVTRKTRILGSGYLKGRSVDVIVGVCSFAPITSVASRAVHFDLLPRRNQFSPVRWSLEKRDPAGIWWSWRESNPRPKHFLVASYSHSSGRANDS